MAYAQLAGLPAYYGLYAAFLPPIIAVLFGSSYQLATGPVAVVSLMTATALAPLATAGSESYIAYAIILAFVVGSFQFLLGLFKLGIIVNFISHPVINGFTNAAALIIATSQLPKLFGVEVDSAEHHYQTVYLTIKGAIAYTHWPTLILGILAFLIMYFLKKFDRRIPNVLAAVILTTLISYFSGYEKNRQAALSGIESPALAEQVHKFNQGLDQADSLMSVKVMLTGELKSIENEFGKKSQKALEKRTEIAILDLQITDLKESVQHHKNSLRNWQFSLSKNSEGGIILYPKNEIPPGFVGEKGDWRLKVGNKKLNPEALNLFRGGLVVGNIPQGLPQFDLPRLSPGIIFDLLTMAVVISLLGFMEAISIAKAIASITGQRIDPNQELIGQGLSNIVGSFSQSYPVSGSFSRSAVNLQAGAVTGLSSVIGSIMVMITLLFFTPLLYHLPQSVLAAIIMMAVVGLINYKGFVHAYQAQRYDGFFAFITFTGTLAFAPHLDKGIILGVLLSIGYFLFRNIKPDMAVLSKYTDGTYRNADRRGLRKCKHIAVFRFNNSLFFANVNYMEEKILELLSTMKQLRHIHFVFNGVNELDASGEATLSLIINRLKAKNIGASFSGVNDNVYDVLLRTNLLAAIGENNIYGNVAIAINLIYDKTHRQSDETECPLKVVLGEKLMPAPEIIEKMKKDKRFIKGSQS